MCYIRISILAKSRNDTREKISFFSHMFEIANQLQNVTRSGWWRNGKALTFCRNFLGLWLPKHWKFRIAYRQWRSNFRRKRKKTKIRKEKPKVTYTVALVMAFLAAENENRLLEDLLQADFGLTSERFLLSVRITWENAFNYKNNNGRNF